MKRAAHTMLSVAAWVACSLFSVPRARVAHSRHKVTLSFYSNILKNETDIPRVND